MDIKNDSYRTTVRENSWYKDKIVKMVGEISEEKRIKMIYGFVAQLHKNEVGE